MARGRFRGLGQLIPKTLEALAQRAADGGDLGPAWSQTLGAPIANISRPLELKGGTLRVEVDGEAWFKELHARQTELLGRLLGPFGGRVKKLTFTLSKRP